ncbi:MAG: M23 family metallopeptidase [Pseudomonadota bacterium]|jgi:murein DD-endopeptidase MepM/ murein hydrolase activator NlpD|nr:M23 family metallopeptidase [Pseudomonadota bacterium]
MAGRNFTIVTTAVVTAILTSAFWIFTYNIINAPSGSRPAGTIERVDPAGGPEVAIAEGVVVGPAGLAIPVAGIRQNQLLDTFTQARAGGGRRHDAIDIMAPAGTPVVAAAPGTVEKLFFSQGGGGITAYVRSDDNRWIYYYAHLQSYAPGLAEGQRVKRGQLIGRVGSTGNANPAGPHLHFAINRMQPGEKWYHGTATNPYPLLAGKRASG